MHTPPTRDSSILRLKTLVFAVVALLAVIAAGLVLGRRGPQRTVVDAGAVVRQATFRSSVTASGEIVATRYAGVGSDTMGRVVDLPLGLPHPEQELLRTV